MDKTPVSAYYRHHWDRRLILSMSQFLKSYSSQRRQLLRNLEVHTPSVHLSWGVRDGSVVVRCCHTRSRVQVRILGRLMVCFFLWVNYFSWASTFKITSLRNAEGILYLLLKSFALKTRISSLGEFFCVRVSVWVFKNDWLYIIM